MIPCSCVPDLIFPRVFWPRVRYGLLFFRHGSVIIWPGQSRQSRHICFSCPPRFRPAAPCCPVSFFLRSVVRRFFSRSSLLSFGSPQIPHAPEFLFFDFIFVRRSWFFRRVLAKPGFFSLGLFAKCGRCLDLRFPLSSATAWGLPAPELFVCPPRPGRFSGLRRALEFWQRRATGSYSICG
jgi:hypothetical protein